MDRRVDRPLQDAPGEQAALLTIRRQTGLKKREHVFGGKLPELGDSHPLDFFHQHRSGCLADCTSVAVKPGLADMAFVVQSKLDPHNIPAKGVISLMNVRRPRAVSPMKGIFVVGENVFLVDLRLEFRHFSIQKATL